MAYTLHAVARSDVGRIRFRNEDAATADADAGLAAVADGMGGLPAGDVASRIAIDEIRSRLSVPTPSPSQLRRVTTESEPGALGEGMRGAVAAANRKILDDVRDNPSREGMGTTLTALRVDAETGRFVVGHVGDSRAYLLSSGQLRRLTRDHTWVQARVDRGLLQPEDARRHPMRHILSRVLGAEADVEPDLLHGTAGPGDVFLLCTDGLLAVLVDGEIEALLLRALPDLDSAAASLVSEANLRGGPDNITVALLSLERPGGNGDGSLKGEG